MGIQLGRVGHIGIHVGDVDRSIAFYRKVLGLKLTGRWGPPDIRRPICFMRIGERHHDVVLFELPEDARKAGVALTDSALRKAPGLDHIALAVTDPATLAGMQAALDSAGVANNGVQQDAVTGGTPYISFYDPDGIAWEFYTTPPR